MSTHAHGHKDGHSHGEKLVKVTIMLEEEQVEAMKELAKEYAKTLNQRWSVSAMARVAIGDFLTKLGKMT